MYKAGFIGVGNMGSALAKAAARSISPADIAISNRTYAKAERLAGELGCTPVRSNIELAKSSRYIFLGVKPANLLDVAREIAPAVNADVYADPSAHIIVTMTASVSRAAVLEILHCPVIQIVPNTPAAIGQGMTIYTGDEEALSHTDGMKEILKGSGDFLYLPEDKVGLVSSISGCTPAYAYMFISALADGGVYCGASREDAIRLAAKAVMGAAAMILETGEHPDKLKDDVCSPGGTTIAGVEVLEKSGFRHASAMAIIAAAEKTVGKKLGFL